MKRFIIHTSFAVLLLFSLGSCKKFLAESSQDEVRPTTTTDLTQLMNGTAYPNQTVVDTYIDLLTDDIQCNGVPLTSTGAPNATYTPYLNNGALVFTWNPLMFDRHADGSALLSGQDSWQIYYNKINGCNLVIDYTDKVSGTVTDKNALLGQALFLRAFYYLKLVTLYGRPYSGAGIDPNTSPGVPLVLSDVVSDVRPARNSLAEVYSQVESDLLKAAPLLRNNFAPTTVFRAGHVAAYALLSRLYLYKGRDEDMDNVKRYADSVFTYNSSLNQLQNYFSASSVFGTAGIYDISSGPEVIWGFGVNPNTGTTYFPQANTFSALTPPFTVSNDLSSLYDKGTGSSYQGDLRYVSYFSKYTNGGTYPLRGFKIGTAQVYGSSGIRVAEVYLNRAEALIRRYKKSAQAQDLSQALSDLNTLRQSRYDRRNAAYVPVAISDADSLFRFCQQERRRELCLEENHRWVDIKRWGLPVTHTYIDATGTSTVYTIPSGSPKYALPIPYTALDNNASLAQNPQ